MSARRICSEWDMHRLNAAAFLEVQFFLGYWKKSARVLMANRSGEAKWGGGKVHDDFEKVVADLRGMSLPVSVVSAERLAEKASRECYVAEISDAITELANRVKDELGTRYVFSLTQAEQELVEPTAPAFGQVVATQFPSIAYDVEQGCKCLGFGLSTAAAFHFLRCIEAGITALSRCLAIPDPTKGAQRNWGAMNTSLKREMDTKWPASSRLSGDGQLFEEAHAALAAMQNPWRNATMHLDQKYTPDEARHIMEMAKGFMTKVASRMDENGLPLA